MILQSNPLTKRDQERLCKYLDSIPITYEETIGAVKIFNGAIDLGKLNADIQQFNARFEIVEITPKHVPLEDRFGNEYLIKF